MPAFGDPSNDPNYKPMPGDHARDSTRGGKIGRTITPTPRPTGKQYSELQRLLEKPQKRSLPVRAVLIWVAVIAALAAVFHFAKA